MSIGFKRQSFIIETAFGLKYYSLPETLQRDIIDSTKLFGGGAAAAAPSSAHLNNNNNMMMTTWYQCLQRLQESIMDMNMNKERKNKKKILWESILDHPMTI